MTQLAFFWTRICSATDHHCVCVLLSQLASLQQQIDKCIQLVFCNVTVQFPAEQQQEGEQQQLETFKFTDMDDTKFAALGRDNPRLLTALLETAQATDKAAWQAFQVPADIPARTMHDTQA